MLASDTLAPVKYMQINIIDNPTSNRRLFANGLSLWIVSLSTLGLILFIFQPEFLWYKICELAF
ncbi:MAG: hypothetical protein SAqBPW_22130 [Shewanella algae]